MNLTAFKALKVGQRVTVKGEQNQKRFSNSKGVIIDTDTWSVRIKFDRWTKGNSGTSDSWYFTESNANSFVINVTKAAAPAQAALPLTAAIKKAPRGPQAYKGNGKHAWEAVTGTTVRLRVPGGWLYGKSYSAGTAMSQTTFVPVPAVVGYPI